ncbi:MAG: hypothetical protein AAGE84_20770 [Cyanobacteria bacterium P01_G01_bin.39]
MSQPVVNRHGDSLISLELVAIMMPTSITTIHSFIRLGVIKPEASMLRLEDT